MALYGPRSCRIGRVQFLTRWHCVVTIGCWMSANHLKLNKDKTELIWINTEKNLQRLPSCGITLTLWGQRRWHACQQQRSHSRRAACHIKSCCQWQVLLSARIHHSLDDESVATLMHAFITTRVDYCNCLLAGAPKMTDKLQHVIMLHTSFISATHRSLTAVWCMSSFCWSCTAAYPNVQLTTFIGRLFTCTVLST